MITRTGHVKFFDAKKGWGYITPSDKSGDLFVHYTDIDGAGYRTLNENDYVEFATVQEQKGMRAVKVKVLTSSQPHEVRLKHFHD
jgi:CspA family cold shock protein